MSYMIELHIDNLLTNFFSNSDTQALKIEIVTRNRTSKHRFTYFENNNLINLNIKDKFCFNRNEERKFIIFIIFSNNLSFKFEFVFENNFLCSFKETREKRFVQILVRAFSHIAREFMILNLPYTPFSLKDQRIKIIGRGSYGTVLFHENHALKFMSFIADIRNPKDNVLREVIPFISIPHHPAMVRTDGYFFHEGHLVLILEYVSNGSLKKQKALDFAKLANIIYEILHFLAFVHSYGFIIRDLSPDNILVDKNFRCKIIDFGVSRFSDSEQEITSDVGKYSYIAPEASSNGFYGVEVDYYSASKIIYDLLNARKHTKKKIEVFLFFNSYNLGCDKKDRISCEEMCVLMESLFSIDELARELELKADFKCHPISHRTLLNISHYIMLHERNSLLLLGCACDFIHLGANEMSENQELFYFKYEAIMMMNIVAYDLMFMSYPIIYYSPIYEYDLGRKLYHAHSNMKFLMVVNDFGQLIQDDIEFDPEIGFKPKKVLKYEKYFLFAFAFMYHSLGIHKFDKNLFHNLLNEIIGVLENYDYSESYKIYYCNQIIKDFDCMKLKKFELAVYKFLVDFGYENKDLISELTTYQFLPDIDTKCISTNEMETIDKKDVDENFLRLINNIGGNIENLVYNYLCGIGQNDSKIYFLILAIYRLINDQKSESKNYFLQAYKSDSVFSMKVLNDLFQIKGVPDVQFYIVENNLVNQFIYEINVAIDTLLKFIHITTFMETLNLERTTKFLVKFSQKILYSYPFMLALCPFYDGEYFAKNLVDCVNKMLDVQSMMCDKYGEKIDAVHVVI